MLCHVRFMALTDQEYAMYSWWVYDEYSDILYQYKFHSLQIKRFEMVVAIFLEVACQIKSTEHRLVFFSESQFSFERWIEYAYSYKNTNSKWPTATSTLASSLEYRHFTIQTFETGRSSLVRLHDHVVLHEVIGATFSWPCMDTRVCIQLQNTTSLARSRYLAAQPTPTCTCRQNLSVIFNVQYHFTRTNSSMYFIPVVIFNPHFTLSWHWIIGSLVCFTTGTLWQWTSMHTTITTTTTLNKLLTVNFLYKLGRLNLIFTHFNGGRTYLLGTPLGAVA